MAWRRQLSDVLPERRLVSADVTPGRTVSGGGAALIYIPSIACVWPAGKKGAFLGGRAIVCAAFA